MERLLALREAGSLGTAHVRLVVEGLGLSERIVWRWIGPHALVQAEGRGPGGYRLTDTDREAFAYFRGNIAAVLRSCGPAVLRSCGPAVLRARAAVAVGGGTAAGVAVPEFLVAGWAGAGPMPGRATLYRAFERQTTPAERAMWRTGEDGRRAAEVYLTRPAVPRNQVWEADHKELPILVLPPRGSAVKPWLTTIVDDGTRALLGWAIALTPHTGTVLTAIRMALVHDERRGPFGAVPSRVRIDRGLEFAAGAIGEVMAALVVDRQRLPRRQPHRKGKVERVNLTVDQTLLCGLPGYTEGPRDAAGVACLGRVRGNAPARF